jgi:lipoate-protein ligase A
MYRRVNHLLVNALTAMGVPAGLAAPADRAPTPSTLPCFAEPGTGEIVVDGRKLAGSAQWQEDGALLQHGSILVDDDQWLIPQLMREPAPPSPAPATLRAILGRAPTLDELADAMLAALRHLEDESVSRVTDDLGDDPERIALLARYRDPAWTWRR